jgi:hypothetical protein
MEELKEIVNIIATLPQIALWVMIGFWAYKVIVVGSVYGVIRLAITKGYEIFTKPKDFDINGICVSHSVADEIKFEISRAINFSKSYLNSADARWLREAIDEKYKREYELMKERTDVGAT